MIMFKKLPYFVYLKEEKYKINVDFRHMISFENNVQDNSMSDEEKIKRGIQEFYPAFSLDEDYYRLTYNKELYKEACEKLIWFYTTDRKINNKSNSSSANPIKQIYSYEYDDEYIWSAFKQYYNIDLSEDKLHWWKFRAIMKSLPQECMFERIKGYRAYTGDDTNLKKLKEYYKLPLPKREQERLDALYEQFK